MKIKVLFFGATADIVGKREIDLDTQPKPVGSVSREIIDTYPALSKHQLLFAVNQNYTDGSEILNDGDELAIFTAVSGG